ncbi:MAG: ABC transporter ATP-binding protein [Candidatus Thermoplasmatota archaeon]|nr:ABC transporter ATP-binding protein [Candidatus Thermoplasmatota archaeon]
MNNEILVKTQNLKLYFPIKEGVFSRIKNYVKAVDNVDIFIKKGETLGIAGESGCGKTTLGRVIIQLIKPTDGIVYFVDNDLTKLNKKKLRKIRSHMQMVFQDPASSLNPRMTVREILAEPLIINNVEKKEKLNKKIVELLKIVGLDEQHMYRYPHEFSGGQRQRIGIARALALNPDFIVLDEPTSALDVSVQAQILNLLKDLQKKFGLTYLFITHNLSVIKHISDRIAIMYAGKIVELAPTQELFKDPIHPYTKALLSAIPIPDPFLKRKFIPLKGEVPSLVNPPSGCRFHPRCNYASLECSQKEPVLLEIKKDHYVACFSYAT